ncbi:MAG: hypothetical protein Q9219_004283 [cf. Caloplaca sp. 3 TL-2023]
MDQRGDASQALSESYDDRSLSNHRSHTLTNKLTSILSVSYADSEIREALRLLDVKNVKNTPDFRRRLHLDLQKEVIECNGSIVKDFGQVAEQLKQIGYTISNLNKCCEDLRRQVGAARQENAPVLKEASTLLVHRQDLEKKKKLLDAFNEHFIVSDEESMALTSITGPIDQRFFTILARIKQIHADCKVLLGSENQRLGLELMDQSLRQLNNGYQRLYRWIQKEFKTLDLENPQINAFIRKSLRTLAERPALFESCLDSFSEAREHVLTDGFYLALTGASTSLGSDPMMKPIELHAHDALRYTGDMLAWTHSTTVSEREALESLLIAEGDEMVRGIQAGRNNEPWSSTGSEVFDVQKVLGAVVNRNMAGVARALQQRVEQAIQGQSDSVTIYKIVNLINFYRVTLTKLLGGESFVLETLHSLEASAMRQFEALQSDYTATLQAELVNAPPDLSVSDVLDEALRQLKALMKSYESSLAPMESREEGFLSVLTQTLKPVLDACESIAKKFDMPANHIFLLNCQLTTLRTLQPFVDFTRSVITQLEGSIESSSAKLIDYQHAFFLHTMGLHPLLTALIPLSDSEEDILKVPTLPPFQPAALAEARQSLDEYLPSAHMDALENLGRLKDSKMAGEITAEAADRFCEDFEFIEGRMAAADTILFPGHEDDNGSSDEEVRTLGGKKTVQRREEYTTPLREIFPRTGGEIRVLLS